MPKMIQIRHVPDEIHRKLKVRAAMAGVSLSEYLLSEARRSLERPTRTEVLDRIARHRPVSPRVPAAEIVRGERDGRRSCWTPRYLALLEAPLLTLDRWSARARGHRIRVEVP
jgi:antitoxin FitA